MRPLPLITFLLCYLSSWPLTTLAQHSDHESQIRDFFNAPDDAARTSSPSTSKHTNNWAVLVSSSRYWFNYRHMANALGMYRTVKRLGIPDSNIILMLADDVACNARNKFPGSVYANAGRGLDLYGETIEVDYRGYEVTVENFIRVLTGRMDESVPRSKRLLTDDSSNIFVYMTGHGGKEFLKFQDNEEISAFDIADAFEQMWQKKRYNEILFMIDTCQANTMYSKLYSPNILATGSAMMNQNSLSYENDQDIGVAVIDSFTHHVLEFMEHANKTSQLTMQDLFNSYTYEKIKSDAGVRTDLFNRPTSKTLITDFFGGVSQAEIVPPVQESPGASAVSQESAFVDPPDAIQAVVDLDDSFDVDHLIAATQEDATPSVHGNRPLRAAPPPSTLAKNARTWSSLALIGTLVGWVFHGKRRSRKTDETTIRWHTSTARAESERAHCQ